MIDKTKGFNWGPALFLIIYQILFLGTFPIYLWFQTPSWGVWIAAVLLLYMTGIGITGGYHRYYSHKSYKTNRFIESIILFFSSMSIQGSALRWSFDHRLHHAHVDTDEDPYSIKKGFWYAHFLWMLEKPKEIDPKVVPDLLKNKLVMFQHKHDFLLMTLTNVLAFLFVGWLCNDYWGAFFVATWLRIFTLHHFTWFINSLAHTWGDKPFCQEQTAVNNYIIALLTFGEGYHNYHHTFANDYRNGIRWYQYDPTKWLIWTLNKLGLTYALRTMDPGTIKKRLVIERKNLLLEQIKGSWASKKEELTKQIHEISERLLEQLSQFNQLKEKYRQLKKEACERDLLQELKFEIKLIRKKIKDDWHQWARLSRTIMGLRLAHP